MKIKLSILVILGFVIPSLARAMPYDFDNGNAAFEIVIQTVAPVVFTEVSPTGGDATLVLRTTTLITNAWFDATAPYAAPAVGVYSRIAHRPAAESATNANLNIALLYASYRVLERLLPSYRDTWRGMLAGVGLDPDDNSTDLTTAVGIGNVAGHAVALGRERDGMNQLGDADGRSYNPEPYRDTTGYAPVNTAYQLVNPSRWQPDMQRQGTGIYKIQQFVTPQYGLTEPYSYKNPKRFRVPPPINSNHHRFGRYKQQADEVLQASANLTDAQKMQAELFDNKINSLGFSAIFAAFSQGLSLREFIELDFLTNMAAHDAGIVIWQEKRRHDAVRPFSAIQYIYGDSPVTAWGGPGQGTVSDLPANEWRSYLEEADHPEYPSASACFCEAHGQAARLYLGNDNLNWTVPAPAGSSRIEPGITPATDIDLFFPTWTQFVDDCGASRVWAGVHFWSAVEQSQRLCKVFGDQAHGYLQELVNGTAAPRPPAVGLAKKGRKHH
ncbi:vanadium-dependent haloperoxidase [Pseudomaricurvus alcaniphilus]|uniref:vanadium-dependent haloperoxidase n=1 Tax=Pseudomaricurvus alcaniphilus TaxID=1166482 RepID=UPI00140CB36F|nr:vanadium-dependent haloperoxidase [Pseudomaricurvus alcaniphilus]NHN38236.1 vanadium-dependent haloperoxidase [Pseudomaricurvus alcaniphilus]